jgi:hypothetical protein
VVVVGAGVVLVGEVVAGVAAGVLGAGVGVVLVGVVVDGADAAPGLAVVPLASPELAVVVGLLLEPPHDPMQITISNPAQILNR